MQFFANIGKKLKYFWGKDGSTPSVRKLTTTPMQITECIGSE